MERKSFKPEPPTKPPEGTAPTPPGYWYRFSITECVLCGATETLKERQYTPKPNDPAERYDYSQYACWSHFL